MPADPEKKSFPRRHLRRTFPRMDAGSFRKKLLGWYAEEARDLPWRRDPTPYKTWISEMMLQQTRVDTVIPYFERFIGEVPDIPSLASIPEDRLMKLWQGLGYYRRARDLKKAAQILLADSGGELPSDEAALRSLPGVGAYSAGAIASIAFGRKTAAPDGNIRRVMARLAADTGDPADPKVRSRLAGLASDLLPDEGAGDFNQALMDLGASVCLPNGRPLCFRCPVRDFCEAFRKGMTLEIPAKPDRKERKTVERTVLLIGRDGRFAIRQRGGSGLLARLYEFPGFDGHLSEEAIRQVLRELGLSAGPIASVGPFRHIFSHIEWDMAGYAVRLLPSPHSPDGWIWATREEIERLYSIPAAFSGFLSVLDGEDPGSPAAGH